MKRAVLLVAALLGAAAAIAAVESPPKPRELVAIEPEEAGADFRVQGEYEGEVAAAGGQAARLAAQVVALGDGRFRAVFLPGGLPGAGWDEKTRIEVPGKTEGDTTSFAPADGAGYAAAISGGTMTGKTDRGERFTLRKVERASPTLGARPPEGAVVLFDGTSTEAWTGRKDERGLLCAGATTKQNFGRFTLHLEFRLPFKPAATDQARGNSGVYIQKRYEVQILDSFGLPPLDNGCGAIYRARAPRINMCLPPLAWQTYDIDFDPPRWDQAGKKTKDAVLTVRQNGVLIHDGAAVANKTGSGAPEGPAPGPINLQDHKNPVFFRNIWIIERKE